MRDFDRIYRNNIFILLFYLAMNELASLIVKRSYDELPWQYIFFYLFFKYTMVVLMLYFSIRYVKNKVTFR